MGKRESVADKTQKKKARRWQAAGQKIYHNYSLDNNFSKCSSLTLMGKISEMIWRWRRHVELNWIEWVGRQGREGQRHVQVDVYDLSDTCQVSKVVAGTTGDWRPLNGKIPRRRVPITCPLSALFVIVNRGSWIKWSAHQYCLFIYLLIHAINFIFTFKLFFVEIQWPTSLGNNNNNNNNSNNNNNRSSLLPSLRKKRSLFSKLCTSHLQ